MSLSRFCLLLVPALFGFCSSVDGDWTQRESRTESSAVPGFIHHHLVLENSATGADATLELARFSHKTAWLHLIDNADGSRSLATAMSGQHCAAGVNGGYFDEKFAPLGLRIIDGKQLSPLVRARLMTGVIVGSGPATRILRVSEFSKKSRPSTAVQCGPFLVDRGRAVAGLESTRAARRTFVATTNSEVMLGFCSDVSLAELSAILAAPEAGLKIQRALNLDGGSSSGFWFKRKDATVFSISEEKSVRDFIAVGGQ